MANYDLDVLDGILQEQKKFLRDGISNSDIWDRQTGMSIRSANSNPEFVALFNRLMGEIDSTLSNSDYPALNRYLMVNMEGSGLVLVINYGDDLVQGIQLDPKKVNFGLLFNVIIPKSIAKINDARG